MDEESKSMDNQTDHSMKAGILFVLLSGLCTILFHSWIGSTETELLKQLIYTILIDFIILFYINMFKTRILTRPHAWLTIIAAYLISLVLLIPDHGLGKYPFWMLGPVMISFLVDVNLSFLVTYGLLFLSLIMMQQSVETIIFELVLGSFLCILARFLKKAMNLFYICVFIVSMCITLLFIKHDFQASEAFTKQNFSLIACYLIVVIAGFMIGSVITFIDRKKNGVSVLEKDEKVTTNTVNSQKNENEISIDTIISENYSLMKQFSEATPKTYQHSKMVAELSRKAANSIGADEKLAYAGGCYHEIGRLKGKNYVELGQEIAEEYHFPLRVREIMRQHNFKTELPRSVEAAIVMLSDNIVSTINYLKANGQNGISVEKVIENTFQVRLKNGTLDEAGIDLQTFNQLKQFYLLELIFDEKRTQ